MEECLNKVMTRDWRCVLYQLNDEQFDIINYFRFAYIIVKFYINNFSLNGLVITYKILPAY